MKPSARLVVAAALGAISVLPVTAGYASRPVPPGALQPSNCVNLPVSSAIIVPSTCWMTGPTSVLVSGSAPDVRTGTVVAVEGQQLRKLDFAGAGRVDLSAVTGGHACLKTTSGQTGDLRLSNMTVGRTPSSSCPAGPAWATSSTAGMSSPSLGAPAAAITGATVGPGGTTSGGPPVPAASYYIWSSLLGPCGAGATSGCPLYVDGANEPAPAEGALAVLDFGAPCFVPNSSPTLYGTELFNSNPKTCTPDSQLVPLVQAFIHGYESTHRSGTPAAVLAVGTSNSLNGVDPGNALTAEQMQASGQAWFSNMVQPLNGGSALPAPITFWGASDIEEASDGNWYGPTPTTAWVNGYGTAAAPGLAAVKTCTGGDPGRLADYGDDVVGAGPTTDKWTAAQIYAVAWGAAVACAVPEVYGPAMASEWAALAGRAQQPPIVFTGPMSLGGEANTLSAADSWNDLAGDTGQTPPYLTVIGVLNSSQPGTPTGVTSVAGEASAQVSWSTPSDGGSPITSYAVTAFNNGAAVKITTVTGVPAPANATVTDLIDFTPYTFTVTATNAAGSGPASAPSNTVTPGLAGPYHPLTPARILDTRFGTGGFSSQLGPNRSIDVQVTGQGNVPSTGVSAVVLNVTVTRPTLASYLTVFPTGVARPNTSNVNFTPGQDVANLVELPVGTDGKVSVYNSSGSVDVIFDVEGWVSTASNSTATTGKYQPLVPARILDTRFGIGGFSKPMGPNESIDVLVIGQGNVPATGVTAVVLNLTITNPTGSSHLTVYPAGQTIPVASNLNFGFNQTVANRVVVALGSGGKVTIHNNSATVEAIADVSGWFSDGSSTALTGGDFTGLTPSRIVDTRLHSGLAGPVSGTVTVSVAGHGGVPPMTAAEPPTAVIMNVTVTNPNAWSHLTIYPSGATQPNSSDLNFTQGQTVPNLVVARLGSDGSIRVFDFAGSTDLVIDVLGWYN